MPHSSSRKESTLQKQVPPKSIDFLLASCDPLFPYTKGYTAGFMGYLQEVEFLL